MSRLARRSENRVPFPAGVAPFKGASEGVKMTSQDELDELCAQLKLSDKAIQKVNQIRTDLAALVREKFKSGPARSNELNELQLQAKKLCDIIRNLDTKSSWRMQTKLGELGFPGPAMDSNADVRIRFENWREALGVALELVIKAADNTTRTIPQKALRGGRTSTLHLYAIHISNIDFAMSMEGGPRLARNGDFQRLCDAVFLVAGVPSTSEGAIKFLCEWRDPKDTVVDSILWDN